jgi:hypothetical protein
MDNGSCGPGKGSKSSGKGCPTRPKGNVVKKIKPINKIVKTKPRKNVVKKKTALPMTPIDQKKPVLKTETPKIKKYESPQDSASYVKYTKANSGIRSKMPYDQWAKNNKPIR